jgi:catechol-2,3-dioxygenase
MIDRVNAMVRPVREVENCTRFYRDTLGFALRHSDSTSAFLSIEGKKGGPILGLLSRTSVAALISEEPVRPQAESIHRS